MPKSPTVSAAEANRSFSKIFRRAAAGCGLLLSEDLQDGFVWRGLTVANPFAEHRHPLLTSILGS